MMWVVAGIDDEDAVIFLETQPFFFDIVMIFWRHFVAEGIS